MKRKAEEERRRLKEEAAEQAHVAQLVALAASPSEALLIGAAADTAASSPAPSRFSSCALSKTFSPANTRIGAHVRWPPCQRGTLHR